MESVNCYVMIGAFFVLSGLIYYSIQQLSTYSRSLKHFRLVGTVSAIYCYPVAACSGMANMQATCKTKGLKMVGAYDQQFLIGRECDDSFAITAPQGSIKQYFCASQRELKAMCNGQDLLLSAPDGDTFTLPLKLAKHNTNVIQIFRGDNIAAVLDLGDEVAKWLSDKLEIPNLRLFKIVSDVYTPFSGRNRSGNYVFTIKDSVEFANKMVTTEPALTPLYFRPNVVISGSRPLDELLWKFIKIGNASFEVTGPDSRIISTINSSARLDWKHNWELYPELPNSVEVTDGCNFTTDLGVNARVLEEGDINEGDLVFAAY